MNNKILGAVVIASISLFGICGACSIIFIGFALIREGINPTPTIAFYIPTAQASPLFQPSATLSIKPTPTKTIISTVEIPIFPTALIASPTIESIPLPQPTARPNDRPPGTSGLCADGTYTQAAHKQGACSHHGGVAQWWGP